MEILIPKSFTIVKAENGGTTFLLDGKWATDMFTGVEKLTITLEGGNSTFEYENPEKEEITK